MLLLYLSLVLCACTVCQAKGISDIISRGKGQRRTWNDLVSDLETMQRNTNRGLDCLSGWTWFESSSYCLVASIKTWFEAQVDCRSMKCYLVEIESNRENKFIELNVQAYGKDTNYWIGATDANEERKWAWFHSGNELRYQNWLPGRPSDDNEMQHYAYIAYRLSGTTMWDDVEASAHHSFICECSKSILYN